MASLDEQAIVVPGYEKLGPLTRAQVDAFPENDDSKPGTDEFDAAKKATGKVSGAPNSLAVALANGSATMPSAGLPRAPMAQALASPPAVLSPPSQATPPSLPKGTHLAQGPGEPLLLRDDQDALTAGGAAAPAPTSSGFGLSNIARAVGLGGSAPPPLPAQMPETGGAKPIAGAMSDQGPSRPSIGGGIPIPPEVANSPQYRLAQQSLQDAKQGLLAQRALGANYNEDLVKGYEAQVQTAGKEIYDLLKPQWSQLSDTENAALGGAAFGKGQKSPEGHIERIGGTEEKQDTTPTQVLEYQYAMKDRAAKGLPTTKSDGTPFSFEDFEAARGEQPSTVKEAEYIKAHPEMLEALKATHRLGTKAIGGALVDENGNVLYKTPDTATLTPDAIDLLANQVILGDTSGIVGMGRGIQGAKNLVAVKNRAAEIALQKGINPQGVLDNIAEFGGQKAGARTAGGIAAKLDVFGESATRAGDFAIQRSNDVPRGNWVPITQLQQMGQRMVSNAPLAKLNAANETLVNEYARAVNAGSGQTTDTAKAHAYTMLNIANSPETYEQVVRSLQWEVNNVHAAASGVAGKLRKGTGGPEPTPPYPLPGEAPQPGALKGNAERPLPPEEAQKLPPGTPFITLDGRHMVTH